jgi:hypothetical protein
MSPRRRNSISSTSSAALAGTPWMPLLRPRSAWKSIAWNARQPRCEDCGRSCFEPGSRHLDVDPPDWLARFPRRICRARRNALKFGTSPFSHASRKRRSSMTVRWARAMANSCRRDATNGSPLAMPPSPLFLLLTGSAILLGSFPMLRAEETAGEVTPDRRGPSLIDLFDRRGCAFVTVSAIDEPDILSRRL